MSPTVAGGPRNVSSTAEPPGVTDTALVRRAQDGDQAALVTLYHRYVNELYAFVHAHTGSVQDAEDLVAETFLRAVQGLPGFERRSTFRTWLYAIARNQVRDFWRRNGRHPAVPLDDRLADAPEEVPACRPEVTALGRAVFAALPDRYRRVLELRVLDGRPVRAVAAELGTTTGNVKVLQHRALRQAARIAGDLAAGPDAGPSPVKERVAHDATP